jgi:hypothetical protein
VKIIIEEGDHCGVESGTYDFTRWDLRIFWEPLPGLGDPNVMPSHARIELSGEILEKFDRVVPPDGNLSTGKTCPDCGGRGRIELARSVVPCKRCTP